MPTTTKVLMPICRVFIPIFIILLITQGFLTEIGLRYHVSQDEPFLQNSSLLIYFSSWNLLSLLASALVYLRLKRFSVILGIVLITSGTWLSILGFTQPFIFLISYMMLGAGQGLLLIPLLSMLADVVKNHLLGLVFGVTFATMALSSLLTSYLEPIVMRLATSKMAILLHGAIMLLLGGVSSLFLAENSQIKEAAEEVDATHPRFQRDEAMKRAILSLSPTSQTTPDNVLTCEARNSDSPEQNSVNKPRNFRNSHLSLLKVELFWLTALGSAFVAHLNIYAHLPMHERQTVCFSNEDKTFIFPATRMVSGAILAAIGDAQLARRAFCSQPRRFIYLFSVIGQAICIFLKQENLFNFSHQCPWILSMELLFAMFSGSVLVNEPLLYTELCPDNWVAAMGLAGIQKAVIIFILSPLNIFADLLTVELLSAVNAGLSLFWMMLWIAEAFYSSSCMRIHHS